jgi:hypothetical protein
MAYSPTYTADDASPIVIDLGLGVVVAMVGFATLIGLVILYGWFKKKTPRV